MVLSICFRLIVKLGYVIIILFVQNKLNLHVALLYVQLQLELSQVNSTRDSARHEYSFTRKLL